MAENLPGGRWAPARFKRIQIQKVFDAGVVWLTYHSQLAKDRNPLCAGGHRPVGHLKKDDPQAKQVHFLQNDKNKVLRSKADTLR